MNEDNVAIRLKGFIESSGLTSSQFADNCGIPRPSLSQLLTGRNKKISDVLIGQIHSAFPQLSVLWLLFGEGDMLVSSAEKIENESEDAFGDKSDDEEIISSTGTISADPERLSASARPTRREGVASVDSQLLLEKEKEIDELRREIERLKRNPRKVAQITVYYDDSTFETFYPAGSNGRSR